MAQATRHEFFAKQYEDGKIDMIANDTDWDELLKSESIYYVPGKNSIQIVAALFDADSIVLPNGHLFAGYKCEKLLLYDIGNAMTYPDNERHIGLVKYKYNKDNNILSLFATDESGLTNVDRKYGLIEDDCKNIAQIGGIPVAEMIDIESTKDIVAILKQLSIELVCDVPTDYLDDQMIIFVESVRQFMHTKRDHIIMTINGKKQYLRDLTVRFYITKTSPDNPTYLLARSYYDKLKAEDKFALSNSEKEYNDPPDNIKNDFAVTVSIDGRDATFNITSHNFFTYNPDLNKFFAETNLKQIVMNARKEIKMNRSIWEITASMLSDMHSTYQYMMGIVDESD